VYELWSARLRGPVFFDAEKGTTDPLDDILVLPGYNGVTGELADSYWLSVMILIRCRPVAERTNESRTQSYAW